MFESLLWTPRAHIWGVVSETLHVVQPWIARQVGMEYLVSKSSESSLSRWMVSWSRGRLQLFLVGETWSYLVGSLTILGTVQLLGRQKTAKVMAPIGCYCV